MGIIRSVFLTLIMILAFVISAGATELTWDAQDDADGFILYHHLSGDISDIKDLDVGDVNIYDLDTLGLTKGVRYEFFLRAYNVAGTSSESDHIRWTYPLDPIIIEMAGAPVNITIKP
jgi:hypothetical protein